MPLVVLGLRLPPVRQCLLLLLFKVLETIPQKVQTGLLWLHRQARLNDERAGLCLFRTTTLLVVGVLVLV